MNSYNTTNLARRDAKAKRIMRHLYSNLVVSKYRTAIPNRRDYYDDLYANGKTDRVGTEEVSDPNILRTDSDVLFAGQHRISARCNQQGKLKFS